MSPNSPRSQMILVVEDHSANQFVARRMLEIGGYSVDVVADGLEAVEACRCCRYDLVLMDLHLPVLSGFEATRQIRGISSQLKIVAVTADVMRDVRERCRDAGMDGYLPKPYTMRQLLDTTHEFISAPSN